MKGRLAGYETLQRILRFVRDGDIDAHDCLPRDVEALHNLMIRWRSIAQRDTPGGSEYMDPEFCERFIAERREEAHKVKLANVRLVKALTAMLEETETLVASGLPSTIGLGLARYQALEAFELAAGKPYQPRRAVG